MRLEDAHRVGEASRPRAHVGIRRPRKAALAHKVGDEAEYVVVDSLCAVFDWCIIYLPFELFDYGNPLSLIEGQNISKEAYNCYQVILMQFTFFFLVP